MKERTSCFIAGRESSKALAALLSRFVISIVLLLALLLRLGARLLHCSDSDSPPTDHPHSKSSKLARASYTAAFAAALAGMPCR